LRRIVLTLIVAAAAGCGGSDDPAGDDDRLEVAAAFYPLEFAARRIGGDAVSVLNLTPVGAEPHDVELTARDVERVRSADVVLLLGEGFQPAVEDAAEGADGAVVDLLEGVTLAEAADEHGDDGDAERDPHVWLDPVRFGQVVTRIGGALGRPEPAADLRRELRALDLEFRQGLADCERHEVVTAHSAFGYLARRYGLEQIAITGLSPEAEPTPGELERVVDEVREHRATTVFFETLVSPRLAETVAREVGADTAVLDPLEGLTEDEVDRGEDYFSIMRSNLAALREALGCR
jgi:zinc transport system substrate-binding protein